MARNDAGPKAEMGNRARSSVTASPALAAVTPLYHRIYTSLHQKLTDGQFARDLALPGETQLAKMYGVGRITVRRALQQLEAERLVVRRPGVGTFPATQEAQERPPYKNIRRWLEAVVPTSDGTDLLDLACDRIRAPAMVAEALSLSPTSEVLRLRRVRLMGNEPLLHTTVYVTVALADLFRNGLDTRATTTMLEEAGVRLSRTEQVISACPSDGNVAEALKVEIGSSLILVRRLIWDDKDRPVHYCETLYRPDRFEYRVRLSRVDGERENTARWIITD